ncbi:MULTISPECIES: CU044_5270 family protein [unclassified Nonomuraea]|uniref:CU044_5270 family protein n=1 Tax=unclassified Nonomuraea TaxID=2593643 RepID=UPI0033D98CA4
MDDDLTLLRELRADAPEPDADRLDAVRARALASPRALAPARRRRRFWAVPSLLAAATVAAAVVVAVNGPHAPAPAPPFAVTTMPVRAKTMLRQAAQVAEGRRKHHEPRPDQWLYRKDLVKQPYEDRGTVQEYWTRYDGTRQALRENGGSLDFQDITPDPDDDDLTPRQYAAKLAALPADPAKLLAHVRADRHWATLPKGEGGEHPDARAFRVLSVYLDAGVPMPPEVEAAVFRALAEIPGVRVDLGVRDAAGRAGIGVAYEPAGSVPGGPVRDAEGRIVSRSYLVLDAETYRFLGRRVDNLQDEVLGGEVTARQGTFYATADLATGVVDEPGQMP